MPESTEVIRIRVPRAVMEFLRIRATNERRTLTDLIRMILEDSRPPIQNKTPMRRP